ncbi:MAG: peptidase MA family metallohydrolase [Elusimicrobiota bacterium]
MKKIFYILILLIIIFSVQREHGFSKESVHDLIFNWKMKQAKKQLDKIKSKPASLMGLYEFYSGNYSKSLKYFKSTKDTEKWEKIILELKPVTRKFKTIQSQYFKIRYTGKDEIIAIYLKDILDKSAENLYKKLNWKPQKKVLTEIYPDKKSFQTASTLTDKQIKVSGAVGICKFNRIMFLSPKALKFGFDWPNTATHEYIHYIVGKVSNLGNFPLWMNEGLAKFLEEIWRKSESSISPVGINYLIQGRKYNKWVELDKMKHGMPNLQTKDDVTLAFAQVQSMIEYMVNRYGWDRISELIYELGNSKPSPAFKKAIGISESELFLKWKDYIKTAELKYTPGAKAPSYAFKNDPVNEINEWVADTAVSDMKLARDFKKEGYMEIALRKYNDALEKDPGNPVVLNRMGKIMAEIDNLKQARESFKEAINSNPSYPPPYINLSSIEFDTKRYDRAENYAKEYIYLSPYNPRAHEILIKIYKIKNNKKKLGIEHKIMGILNES